MGGRVRAGTVRTPAPKRITHCRHTGGSHHVTGCCLRHSLSFCFIYQCGIVIQTANSGDLRGISCCDLLINPFSSSGVAWNLVKKICFKKRRWTFKTSSPTRPVIVTLCFNFVSRSTLSLQIQCFAYGLHDIVAHW